MSIKKRVLIIDDNEELLESLELYFLEKDYIVYKAQNGEQGLKELFSKKPEVAIVDIRLPDIDGITILKKIRDKNISTKIIIITAFQDMETTINAIKLGAYEYIHKPIDIEELDRTVENAIYEKEEVQYLEVKDEYFRENTIIGKSKSMKEIFKLIGLLSEVKTTVLITGESGTGKELIARAIHFHGKYASEPFIGINCSAIVENLWESELFGHEKGSFSGAIKEKIGKLELAKNGTIFLDEIAEIPLTLQAKLLRVIQEKEFERVGGNKKLRLNARIIAATNRDIEKMVKNKFFRKDLLYRLKVFEIKVPPLRERKEDIPILVNYLVNKINKEIGKKIKRIPIDIIHMFKQYSWPGNIRELENVLTRAMILSKDDTLDINCVSNLLYFDKKIFTNCANFKTLEEVEREYIEKILHNTGFNISKSAKILGITRPTLRKKIKQWNII